MSNNPSPTMADRIERTLMNLGFNECILQGYRDGQVTLFCPKADRNDHNMIQVAVRLIPGIQSVVFATNLEIGGNLHTKKSGGLECQTDPNA